MSIKHLHLVCAGVVLVLIGACGQKGPLYLPDKHGSVVKKPAATSPQAPRPPEKIDPEHKDDSQNPPSP